jgi:YidC/Oxa1 family membrane protein insertase
MQAFWTTVFYQPIYNALILIMNHITFGDVGFAIIVITLLVKLILSPLTKKSIRSQVLMKRMEPELKQIKKDFPNKEEQAAKTFELYKKYGTNPFSGCLVVLIQLPIIFTLYYMLRVFSVGTGPLYSFVHAPTIVRTAFLGFFDIHSKSITLAIVAGILQFIQGYLSMPVKVKKAKKVEVVKEMAPSTPKTFQEELSDSMQMNVRYILPLLMAYIAYRYSVAVALYVITTSVFAIVQEWYIRRSLEKSNY